MVPERYSLENLRRVLANPRLLHRELFQIATTVNSSYHALGKSVGTDDSLDVVSADWDNLLILDACRYDMFARRHDRLDCDGDLERVQSKGSDSWGFMKENFAGRELHDTVYVTANPHVDKLEDGTFHAVVNLLDRCWDEEAKTVLPRDVVEHALDAHERFPEKRLLVHFMQPHFPFLGDSGSAFYHAGIERELDGDGTGNSPNPWFDLIYSEGGDAEQVVAAYEENLDVVLPAVESLADQLTGKTVVTADHGNLVGERGRPVPVRMYGHPRGLHRDELLAVPWFEIECAERRTVVAEPPVESADVDQEVVEQRLRHLGYQ